MLAIFVSVFLLTIIFLNPTSVGSADFVSNINLWAGIWAVNFLLFLTLTFLLARDLIKLFFEYQAGHPGSRLKSKLITTFIIFSMFPALIMSFLAIGLINRNLRLWLTSPSEQLFTSSDLIVDGFYRQNRTRALLAARLVAADSGAWATLSESEWNSLLSESGVQAVWIAEIGGEILLQRGESLAAPSEVGEALSSLAGLREFYSRRRLNDVDRADEDLVLAGVVLEGQPDPRVMVAEMVMPSVEFHAIQVEEARRKSEELKSSVRQIEINYFFILISTTLAVIFGFVWLGTYIARKLTVPLEALAEGAGALAQGDFEHRVEVNAADELGILVDAFNRMAEEIKQSRHQLEQANEELQETNRRLDERRRYTETILQNIATGVLTVDEDDRIRTVNRAALSMLEEHPGQVLDRALSEVGAPELQAEFQKMKERVRLYGTYRQDITFQRGGRQYYIAATATANPAPQQTPEYLIVLDDLTELIRAQKFAAWQEVARRLAHEIKNPLTPIQLSAERIKRRFAKLDGGSSPEMKKFGKVLDEAVRIIQAESELLKTLLLEFSRFARLPISKPVDTDLHQLIDQTLSLFDGAFESVELEKNFDGRIEDVKLDREQMRRVFVNLIDNSLDALSGCNGQRRLVIATKLNQDREAVTIELSDNGTGIAAEDYENLFLPYFSTKKKGSGLGLAIVRQIITEHNGFIRARPNQPQGMTFTIDIPLG